MSFMNRSAVLAVGLALAAPTFAMADTYTLAHFSGGVFGNNAAVQPPFGDAGITRGMALSGTFLIDDNSNKSGLFNNVLYSSYPDAALIPGATDFSFGLGSLLFTGSGDPGAATQYHNGHFNGFAYSSDFTFENVGYNLTISGGTFQIQQQGQFSPLVAGFINIGDNNVTGGTPFTPPQPGGPGVPEPAAWALMILGFGATGAMMRRRRGLALTA